MPESGYNQFADIDGCGDSWRAMIARALRELVVGSSRFNELRRGVPRMSPALLSKRLKDLESAGIVTRHQVKGEPGSFEYRLTEAGQDLKPVIETIGNWGQRWVETGASLWTIWTPNS